MELFKFLRKTKEKLGTLDAFVRVHAVLGNEACDLDSAVSAITYAYMLFEESYEHEPDTLFLPILNIARADYALKTEVTFALGRHDITPSCLTFRDDLDLSKLRAEGKLRLTLVDFNVFRTADADLESCVVEVIDHHKNERLNKDSVELEIEPVGSCTTLVAERLLRRLETVPQDVLWLLYGTILLDTIKLSEAAKRTTPRDVAMVSKLEEKVEATGKSYGEDESRNTEKSRDAVYRLLLAARSDVSGLSPFDLLRKDMKVLENDDSTRLVMSSIPISISDFVESLAGSDSLLEDFLTKQTAQALVIMSLCVDADDKPQRQLAVYATTSQLQTQLMDAVRGSLEVEKCPMATSSPQMSIFAVHSDEFSVASFVAMLGNVSAKLDTVNLAQTPDITMDTAQMSDNTMDDTQTSDVDMDNVQAPDITMETTQMSEITMDTIQTQDITTDTKYTSDAHANTAETHVEMETNSMPNSPVSIDTALMTGTDAENTTGETPISADQDRANEDFQLNSETLKTTDLFTTGTDENRNNVTHEKESYDSHTHSPAIHDSDTLTQADNLPVVSSHESNLTDQSESLSPQSDSGLESVADDHLITSDTLSPSDGEDLTQTEVQLTDSHDEVVMDTVNTHHGNTPSDDDDKTNDSAATQPSGSITESTSSDLPPSVLKSSPSGPPLDTPRDDTDSIPQSFAEVALEPEAEGDLDESQDSESHQAGQVVDGVLFLGPDQGVSHTEPSLAQETSVNETCDFHGQLDVHEDKLHIGTEPGESSTDPNAAVTQSPSDDTTHNQGTDAGKDDASYDISAQNNTLALNINHAPGESSTDADVSTEQGNRGDTRTVTSHQLLTTVEVHRHDVAEDNLDRALDRAVISRQATSAKTQASSDHREADNRTDSQLTEHAHRAQLEGLRRALDIDLDLSSDEEDSRQATPRSNHIRMEKITHSTDTDRQHRPQTLESVTKRKIVPSVELLSDTDTHTVSLSPISTDSMSFENEPSIGGMTTPGSPGNTSLGGGLPTPTSSTVEPIPEYSARQEFEDNRYWKSVQIGQHWYKLDMKVIEPYKKVLSHGGYYGDGFNAIIVFTACYLPDRRRRDYHYVMDNLFLYVISTLELLVVEDYMIVYFHGATPQHRMPSLTWLKRCYDMIDRRLRKNLKGLLIVHPTIWLRTLVFMTRPFVSAKFSAKIRYIKNLGELTKAIPTEYIYVPQEVQRADRRSYPAGRLPPRKQFINL